MTRLCSIEGCENQHYALSYCLRHHRRFKAHGDPLGGGVSPTPRGIPCKVDGCDKPSVRRGYCAMHNKRLIRHGAADGGKFVKGEQEGWLRQHIDHQPDACLIWPYRIEENGYGAMHWDGTSCPAHRVMCRLAHGEPIDPKMQAAHSCNNRRCVNPRHLRWATAQENSLEKNDHGTMLVGEVNPASVLTEDQVREVLALKGTATLKEVAERYGVHLSTIHCIWQGKTWAWLSE